MTSGGGAAGGGGALVDEFLEGAAKLVALLDLRPVRAAAAPRCRDVGAPDPLPHARARQRVEMGVQPVDLGLRDGALDDDVCTGAVGVRVQQLAAAARRWLGGSQPFRSNWYSSSGVGGKSSPASTAS